MKLIAFCKPQCSACDTLKSYLKNRGMEFQEIDGSTPEGKTFMRTHGVFPAYYPALCIGGKLYEYSSLFDENGALLDLSGLI
jgi:hypothetical protein